MNKINKKPKNKTFNKQKNSLNKKEKVVNKRKDKKIVKNNNKTIESDNEFSDDLDLKHGLNEIINDFKKSDNKLNKKSIDKSLKSKPINKLNKTNTNKSETTAETQDFVPKQSQKLSSFNESFNGQKLSRKSRKLLIKTQTKWFEMRLFDDTIDLSETKDKYTQQMVQELRREAQELLRTDIELYNELQEQNNSAKSQDFNWIRTVLRSGTLADKLSAHTILIQDSPIHNLKSLEQIISMVNTKGKRECIMALDNLRELFVGDLLIPNKKLKSFSELIQFFDHQNKDKKFRNRQLVLCLFEEQLKALYRLFLDSVVKVSHDSVETTKQKSLITFFDLLINNGEQEQYLLENLVNKLGDPLPKLAAQASHLLNQLCNQYHPLMKTVVVEAVERLLYRPNIAQRAQYYGLCFLSETIFSADDRPLANKLIKIYFGFFNACIKKGDINNKMMSVLLTGVSRAFPYSKLETNVLEEHLQTFYKIIHFVSLNTSIQALLLIFNIIDVNESGGQLTDRFYSVLYRHLQDSQLESCSRKAMFLNLIFRAMKRDPILKRVKAFIKRLLQIALTQTSSLATSILILISEIIRSKPGLMLTKEIKEVVNQCDEEEDEEKYEDLPLSDDEVVDESKSSDGQNEIEKSNQLTKSDAVSWVHNRNADTNVSKSRHYDPMARNPLFASAETTDLWELELMKLHFHPSTNLFAQKILNNEPIDYSGDPLQDFTLKHFLDRFVFRNPKKVSKKSTQSTSGRVFGRTPVASDEHKSSPSELNSKQFVNQSESKISIDERFIHQFMKQRIATKADRYESDVESVTSVEFESLLDRLEPMSKEDRSFDFAKELYKESKNKNKKQQKKTSSDEELATDESDDQLADEEEDEDPDDELNFDADDPDFADAFDGIDSELEEALDTNSDRSGAKKRKKGFDSMTNQLFVSADEFAQLLEANESDESDLDGAGDEETNDLKTDIKNRRKLGRNKKKKKFNKKDLDL